MSIKKGYCTNCNKNDEGRRIFDVNTDAKFCYCPHCGKKYTPKVAIHNYDRVISLYLKRGYYYLRNTGNPKTAYSIFAYVLELEHYNKTAKLGRLLSLAYLSTLRRNRFLEVKELLLMENEIFQASKTRREYTAFLVSLHKCVQDYITKAKKKLTFKEYFYDINCLKLYYSLISDAITILRVVVDELSMIEEEKLAFSVSDTIKEYEKEYDVSFFTVDGQEQRLVNFTKNGEPLIVNGKKKEDTNKLQRYRMASLQEDKKKNTRYIKDNVFTRVYLRMHRSVKAFLPSIIIGATLFTVILVLFFIFIKNASSIVALVFAIVIGGITLILLALRLIFVYVLRKTRF